MNPVQVKNVKIGEGIPKICVPVTGVTEQEIMEEARAAVCTPADIIEWRADWFEEVLDLRRVKEVLAALRGILQELPLLFTFRTMKEGGEREVGEKYYKELNKAVIASGYADLVDVELFAGDMVVKELVSKAHERGVKVVISNHDFEKTPGKEELVERIRRMQKLGADLPKIAVMPQCKKDVLVLLEATEEMNRCYADTPVITMSMSGEGVISRICGEVFGSAVTFGSAGKASAPGQMKVEELETVLTLLHGSI